MSARNKIGVGHDGTHNAFAKRGEPVLAVHHDPNIARRADAMHGDKSIARSGAPKRLHPVSIHNAMTERQQALKGMQHANAVAPDANPASPLSKIPAGKEFVGKPVPASPGMRSRTSQHSPDLGKFILAEAFANSSADDRMALCGINPTLPIATNED
jgi:hypothetical protein